MTSKLEVYNLALATLGQRELQSLSDPTESRRVLDRLWDAGLVNKCLEEFVWHFATRTVQVTSDPPNPSFGYTFRFIKPNDWIKTSRISTNERFDPLLDQYADEAQSWYADVDPLYIQYVSNHPSYGGNMSAWPESFNNYVAVHLAVLASTRLLGIQVSQTVLRGQNGLYQQEKAALKKAKSKDSAGQPPSFPPVGTWVQSRRGDLVVPRLGNKLIG